MSKEKPEAKTKPLYDVRRVHIGKNAYVQELSHECGELYSRTTKLPLDLSKRSQGGVNSGKRAYLEETAKLLDEARAFYVAFFLAHAEKVTEQVPYFSEHHQEMRERLISADKLLTWTEFATVETAEHPQPLPDWNFSRAFLNFPFVYRRSVIKDA
jgi:hypothetical protein